MALCKVKGDVASITLINSKSEMLVMFRPEKKWCHPGGLIEDGETPFQAAKRELKEETDVDINLVDLKYFGNFIIGKWRVHFFVSTVWENEAKNMERNKCLRLSWKTAKGLEDLKRSLSLKFYIENFNHVEIPDQVENGPLKL